MKLRKHLLLLLSFISFSAFSQSSLTGTWNSSFGELRLLQVGNTVVGDYANLGVIEGTIENNTLKGRFTNKKNEGEFEWKVNGNAFTGKWWWMATPNDKGDWNGNLTQNGKPVLRNEDETGHTSEASKGIRLGVEPKSVALNKPTKNTTVRDILLNNPTKINDVTINTEEKPREPEKKPNWVNASNINSQNLQNKTSVGNNEELELAPEVYKPPIVSADKSLYCTVTEAPYKAKFDKLYMIAPSLDIQPGVLLNTNEFDRGEILPIILNSREPMKITVRDGSNYSKTGTATKFNASTNELVASLKTNRPTPLSSNYEIIQVYSQNDLKFAFKMTSNQQGELAKGIGKVESEREFKTNLDNKVVTNYYLLSYQETLQTASADNPYQINGTNYFSNEAIPENAVYVSEVGYGKLIYFLIETKSSVLNFGFSGKDKTSTEGDAKIGSKKGGRELDLSFLNNSENQSIKITALAAGSRTPLANNVNDLTALRKEINDFIAKNTEGGGTPIYYKLKLAKTNQNMTVAFQDKVTRRECKLVGGNFKVAFDNLFAWDLNETGTDEIYGIGWADMYVVDKNGKHRYIMPSNKPYLNQRSYTTGQGRILEIARNATLNVGHMDIVSFPQNERTFKINAKDYGYETLDQAMDNTYLRMRFKPKEYDGGNDDEEFNTGEQSINLGETPKIAQRNKQEMSSLKISNDKKGVIKYSQHGAQYGVSYSVTPF